MNQSAPPKANLVKVWTWFGLTLLELMEGTIT